MPVNPADVDESVQHSGSRRRDDHHRRSGEESSGSNEAAASVRPLRFSTYPSSTSSMSASTSMSRSVGAASTVQTTQSRISPAVAGAQYGAGALLEGARNPTEVERPYSTVVRSDSLKTIEIGESQVVSQPPGSMHTVPRQPGHSSRHSPPERHPVKEVGERPELMADQWQHHSGATVAFTGVSHDMQVRFSHALE